MKFKNMEVVFTVSKDTAFEDGRFGTDRSGWTFTVKRYKSGAFAYGDRSAHSIDIDRTDNVYADSRYFDTRYDSIPTNSDEWVSFWKNFIEDDYQLVLSIVSTNEELIDIED